MKGKQKPQCQMSFFFKQAVTEFKDLQNIPQLKLKYEDQYKKQINQQINLKFPRLQIILRVLLFLQVISYPFALRLLFSNLSNLSDLPKYIILVCSLSLFRVFFKTQTIWLQFQLEASVRKALCKQISQSCIYSNPQNDNHSTIWNLINNDSQVAVGYFQSKQELVFEGSKLLFGIWYLYNTFNSAIFYGIGIVLLLTSTISYASRKIVKLTDQLTKIKDSKFKIVMMLIQRIRQIKMCRLQNYFNQKIKSKRDEQFGNLTQRKMWDSVCVGAWQLTHIVLSFSVFSIYLGWYQGAINFEVESILYILQMLIMPLNGLPWYYSGMIKAKQALGRIHKFISTHPKSNYQNIEYNQQLPPSLIIDQPGKINLINLHINKLSLQKGNVYCLQSTSKSGRSVFLKSLLGMFQTQYKGRINGKIGYVDQGLFHINKSMSSITSSLDLNRSMVNQQLKDLLLKFHCLQIPFQNSTSTYSGGQKLRLALVRAFYNNNVILIDSDLNSLDKKVRKHIECQILSIAKKLNKIVIIASNNNISDNILLIQNGILTQTKIQYANNYNINQHQQYIDSYYKNNCLQLQELFKNDSSRSSKSDKKQQNIKLKHFLFYFKNIKHHLIFIVSIIILFFMKNYYKFFINNSIYQQNFLQRLTVITLLYILAVVFRSYYFAKANLIESKRIGQKIIETVSFGNIKFYQTYGKQKLATRALSDMSTTDNDFSFEINILFNNIFQMVFKIGVLVWSFLPMAVPVIVFMIDFYQNFFRYRKVSKVLETNSNNVNEKLLQSVNILEEGKILIKGMKQQAKYLEIFNNRLDQYINNKACISAQDRRFAQRFFLTTQILMLLVLSITYWFRDSISATDTHIKLAITAMIGVTDYFGWFSKSIVTCENVSQTLKRQSDCIDSVGYIDKNRMNERIKDSIRNKQGKENLKIQNLKFKYEEDGQYILNGLQLQLSKDQKILIRGKTGSGKTTLFKILTGLYPQSISLSELNQNQYISFSPQKPLILPGNLKQNLDPYHIFTETQIKQFMDKFSNNKIQQLTNTEQLLVNVTRAQLYGRSNVTIYDQPLVVPKQGTQIIVSHHGQFSVNTEYQLLHGKLHKI